MKQFKKMLSLVLALIMALSCMAVVANAADAPSTSSFSSPTQIAYNHADYGELSADQVSKMVLDWVDDLLAGLIDDDTVNTILGLLSLEINSFDNICSALQKSIVGTALGNVGGDLKNLDRSAVKNSKRSNGDTKCIIDVVALLGDNFSGGAKLSKVAYGIDKAGSGSKLGVGALYDDSLKLLGVASIDLGFTIPDALSDVEIADGLNAWDLINDIPGQLKALIYDILLNASYAYTKNNHSENMTYAEAKAADSNLGSYDGMLTAALYNLLTTPQDYEYEGEGEDAVKVWDADSIISRDFAALDKNTALGLINLQTNSIIDILDNILQIAYDEFGVPALNNNLKWIIADGMGAERYTLDNTKDAALIAKIKADPDFVDPDSAAAYGVVKNYLVNDQMWEVDGTWYYRSATHPSIYDEEGNEIGEYTDYRYYQIDMETCNAMADFMNWDYDFTGVDVVAIKNANGGIFASLNNLLALVLDKGINKDFVEPFTGNKINLSTLWESGSNEAKLNDNIVRLAKWVAKNYAGLLFGKTSEYVSENGMTASADFAAKLDSYDTISLIEYIGLPFFKDAMPQLVLPTPNAGANFVFDNGVQILEFGILVIREFITDITPNVNYDDVIFQAGTLTSAGGRKMASHTQEEWVNILLNMGVDIGYTYLYNLTDFGDTKTALGVGLTANQDFTSVIPSHANGAALTDTRWKDMLNEVFNWGYTYVSVSQGNLLNGISKNEVNAYADPIDKLSYVLNKILPLGFISDCTTANFDFDLNVVLDKIIALATDFDLEGIIALFGRNTASSKNILMGDNVLKQVIDLLNWVLKLVLGRDAFPAATSFDNLITQANVKSLLENLINGIDARSAGILYCGLPIAALIVKDWGGEDQISNPTIEGLSDTLVGAPIDKTITVETSFAGLWNSYYDGSARQYDGRYSYKVTNAKVVDLNGGTDTKGISVTGFAVTTINDSNPAVSFKISGTPTVDIAMLKLIVTYDVMAGSTTLGTGFTTEKIFAAAKSSLAGGQSEFYKVEHKYLSLKADGIAYAYSPYFANTAAGGESLKTAFEGAKAYWRYGSRDSGNYRPYVGVTVSGGTQYGFSIASTGAERCDGDGRTTNFTVDAAAFDANKPASGTVATWTMTGVTNGDTVKTNNTGTVKVYFFDGAARNALKDLAKDELTSGKKAYEYDATAWANYQTALNAAALAGYTTDNAMQLNTNKDFAGLQANLEAAIAALAEAKLPEDEIVAPETTNNNEAAIASLKATMEGLTVEQGKRYSDFYLYRLDRFEDVKDDANSIINTAAAAAAPETKYFPYTNAVKGSQIQRYNGPYSAFVRALLENYTAEQIAASAKSAENAQKKINNMETIDIANTEYLLLKNASRLTQRAGNYDYLADEIASAVNQIGTTNTGYTERSWNAYASALAAAQACAAGNTPDAVPFDVKYALQEARNNLLTADEEADYEELEALMAQAQVVLDNYSNYANEYKEFGQLLAALGMNEVVFGNDSVELFPNSAKIVNSKSYAADDQKKVDNAANALRKALAVMTFKYTDVPAEEIKIAEDAEGNDITASVAKIAQKLTVADTKTALTIDGAETEVSINGTYALVEFDDANTFTGTGSTVTFYKTVSGVKVPVATVNIVVNGDVNGDGVVDALDASAVELVAGEHASLSGLFFIAGNQVDADEVIDAADYGEVVNLAKAG